MSILHTIKYSKWFKINLLFYVSTNVEVAHRLMQSMRLFIKQWLRTGDRHTVTIVMFLGFFTSVAAQKNTALSGNQPPTQRKRDNVATKARQKDPQFNPKRGQLQTH